MVIGNLRIVLESGWKCSLGTPPSGSLACFEDISLWLWINFNPLHLHPIVCDCHQEGVIKNNKDISVSKRPRELENSYVQVLMLTVKMLHQTPRCSAWLTILKKVLCHAMLYTFWWFAWAICDLNVKGLLLEMKQEWCFEFQEDLTIWS